MYHVLAGARGGQRGYLIPLNPELEEVVSHQIWLLAKASGCSEGMEITQVNWARWQEVPQGYIPQPQTDSLPPTQKSKSGSLTQSFPGSHRILFSDISRGHPCFAFPWCWHKTRCFPESTFLPLSRLISNNVKINNLPLVTHGEEQAGGLWLNRGSAFP